MIEPSLCIVIHDVAPATWRRCRKILEILETIDDFQVTLLAVPHEPGGTRNSGFERWLRHRSERGDEIALHGFDAPKLEARNWADRLQRRVFNRRRGEFTNLPLEEANARLQSGFAWLRELNLTPSGFVAPVTKLSANAWQAVSQQPLEYTCTRHRLYLLPEARSVRVRGQAYSSASSMRRVLSVSWNELLAWMQRKQPVVRLELHPGDLHPLSSRSWQWLASQQTRNRRVCTLRDLARDLRNTPGATEPAPI